MTKDLRSRITVANVAGALTLLGCTTVTLVWLYHRHKILVQQREMNDMLEGLTVSTQKKTRHDDVTEMNKQEKVTQTAAKISVNTSVKRTEPITRVSDKPMTLPKPPTVEGATVTDTSLTYFSGVGVSLPLFSRWSSQEEANPVPNAALILLQRDDFAGKESSIPGDVPMVMLTVEDLTGEKLTAADFMTRSKHVAQEQMAMMTQGMFQPEITKETKETHGPFTHVLSYTQALPMFSIKVQNFVAVVDDVGYLLQVMVSPALFDMIVRDVTEIANESLIEPPPRVTGSTLTVTQGDLKIVCPSSWILASLKAKKSSLPARFVFETPSQTCQDRISVYEHNKWTVPSHWKKVEEETFEDMLAVYYQSAAAKEPHLVLSSLTNDTGFVVVASPVRDSTQRKRRTLLGVSRDTLAEVCRSAVARPALSSDKRTRVFFTSDRLGLGFDVSPTTRILESRLSKHGLLFAPHGLPESEETAENPLVTVRVGTPQDDDDCRSTLDEWEKHIRKTTASSEDSLSSVDSITRCTLGGRECISFTSTEQQMAGPGEAIERAARSLVFLKNETTIMFRLETTPASLAKAGKELEKMVETLEIHH